MKTLKELLIEKKTCKLLAKKISEVEAIDEVCVKDFRRAYAIAKSRYMNLVYETRDIRNKVENKYYACYDIAITD